MAPKCEHGWHKPQTLLSPKAPSESRRNCWTRISTCIKVDNSKTQCKTKTPRRCLLRHWKPSEAHCLNSKLDYGGLNFVPGLHLSRNWALSRRKLVWLDMWSKMQNARMWSDKSKSHSQDWIDLVCRDALCYNVVTNLSAKALRGITWAHYIWRKLNNCPAHGCNVFAHVTRMCTGEGGNAGVHDGQSILPPGSQDHLHHHHHCISIWSWPSSSQSSSDVDHPNHDDDLHEGNQDSNESDADDDLDEDSGV